MDARLTIAYSAPATKLCDMTTGERLPRRSRIQKRGEFGRVFATGWRVQAAGFRVVAIPNDLGHSRLGLAVGRKVGNAVVRNRVKRRVREVFRRSAEVRALAMDFVVIPESAAARFDFATLRSVLLDLFLRGARRRAGASDGRPSEGARAASQKPKSKRSRGAGSP